MLTRAELKAKSREQLRGRWGSAVCVALILIGISFVLSFIMNLSKNSWLNVIVQLLIDPILYYGVYKYFLDLTRGGNPEPSYLFDNFSAWGKAVLTNLLMGLIIGAWALLVIIPMLIIVFLQREIFTFISIMCLIASAVLITIVQYRYRQVYFIMIDNAELTPLEILRKSKEMMIGHKLKLFVLDLSFIGWFILGVLLCGIGIIFLMPYIMTTYANFYNSIKPTANTETDVFTIDPQYQNEQ